MRFANPVFLSPLAAQIAVCAFVVARRPGLGLNRPKLVLANGSSLRVSQESKAIFAVARLAETYRKGRALTARPAGHNATEPRSDKWVFRAKP